MVLDNQHFGAVFEAQIVVGRLVGMLVMTAHRAGFDAHGEVFRLDIQAAFEQGLSQVSEFLHGVRGGLGIRCSAWRMDTRGAALPG